MTFQPDRKINALYLLLQILLIESNYEFMYLIGNHHNYELNPNMHGRGIT